MSDCPDRRLKVLVFEVIAQQRLWHPSKVLVAARREFGNTLSRYTSEGKDPDWLFSPLRVDLSDTYRLFGGVMDRGVLNALEEVLGHILEHLGVRVLLVDQLMGESLHYIFLTHFPFSLTIRKTLSEE